MDAVLTGRKTWQVAASQAAVDGTTSGGSGIAVVARYLFSRTLREARAGVELVASDVGGYVQRLKRHPGKGICLVGGVELASSLFEAGIIDEVSLNVHPVLFGSGIPFSRHESAVSASN